MLFNLDRNTKQSILEQFKREALLYQQKREQEKQQKIKEEREYLLERNRKDDQTFKILQEEKLQKQNQQMQEYQKMLINTNNTGPHNIYSNRKREVVNKNWGGVIQDNINYQRANSEKKFNTIDYDKEYNSLSPYQKEKAYIRKSDIMDKFLTDDQNEEEVKHILKDEKNYRQHFYRDLLNSQYEEAQKKNMNRYGTNDILIIENKRKKFLAENPYTPKKKYDFGRSSLLHNPILNPENNIEYNKYLNLRFKSSNFINNKNEEKCNDNNFSNSIEEYNKKNNNNYNSMTIPHDDRRKRVACSFDNYKKNFNENNNKLYKITSNVQNILSNNNGNIEENNILNDGKNIIENTNKDGDNELYKNDNNNQLTIQPRNSYSKKDIDNYRVNLRGSILSQAAKSNFL